MGAVEPRMKHASPPPGRTTTHIFLNPPDPPEGARIVVHVEIPKVPY
jgi:hypothetical protein